MITLFKTQKVAYMLSLKPFCIIKFKRETAYEQQNETQKCYY